MTEEHTQYKQIVHRERENMTRQSSEPDADQRFIAVFMVTCLHQRFYGGILLHHNHGDNHNNLPHLMSQHSS